MENIFIKVGEGRLWVGLKLLTLGNLWLWSEVKLLSHVRLFATPWTVTYQAPPSMGFSRQEYWSGLPFPSPGDLPHPGTEPTSPALAGGFFIAEPPGKPQCQWQQETLLSWTQGWAVVEWAGNEWLPGVTHSTTPSDSDCYRFFCLPAPGILLLMEYKVLVTYTI